MLKTGLSLTPCCTVCFAIEKGPVSYVKPNGTPPTTCDKLYACARCLFANICSQACQNNHIPCRSNAGVDYEKIKATLIRMCPDEAGSYIIPINPPNGQTEIQAFPNPALKNNVVAASVRLNGQIIGASHFLLVAREIKLRDNTTYAGPCDNNNLPNGYGIKKIPGKAVLWCTFKAGKSHGKGRIEYLSGDVAEGVFTDGRMNGAGTYTWKNNQSYKRYEGMFQNDDFHGPGKLTLSSGEVIEGLFEKGNLVGTITHDDPLQK